MVSSTGKRKKQKITSALNKCSWSSSWIENCTVVNLKSRIGLFYTDGKGKWKKSIHKMFS